MEKIGNLQNIGNNTRIVFGQQFGEQNVKQAHDTSKCVGDPITPLTKDFFNGHLVDGKEIAKKAKQSANVDDTEAVKEPEEERFSQFSQKHLREFLNTIYSRSPEKAEFLIQNETFCEFFNSSPMLFDDDLYEALDDYSPEIDEYAQSREVILKAIDNLSLDEIKYVISSLTERLDGEISADFLFSGIVLYSHNKEAFEYIIHSSKQDYNSRIDDLCKYICCKNQAVVSEMDLNTIIEIEKSLQQDFYYGDYTYCSDDFVKNRTKGNKLREFLSKNISDGDFTVYRGEKSTWMFDSIPIDKEMEDRIRKFVSENPDSKKDTVVPNDHMYKHSDNQKISVYDSIKSKDKLTLADAMNAAKYCDEETVNQILEKINNAEVEDNNFKSYTLNRAFANRWILYPSEKSCIMLSKTTIKKGNQVGFASHVADSEEFIVNDNKKKMTFSNVRYDREKNIFFFDSTLEAIEE